MDVSERLRTARTAVALTLQAASERTGLGVSSLSEFETGRREPRLGQLKKLADAYRRSVSYFLDDVSPAPEVVLWRQRPESPSAAELQAQLIQLSEWYRTLERLCDEHAELELPHVTDTAQRFGYSAASRLAHQVRKDLALGDRPGQTLLRVLEEVCNVKVFHLPFEPTGCAACTVSEQTGAAVLLNAKNVRWRRNFDLAHELFHLLTWQVFRHNSAPVSVADDQEEKLATCFARNLLMPEEAFRDAVNSQRSASDKLDFDGLFEVARTFDVSVEAVLWQTSFIFKVDSQRIQTAIQQLQGQIGFWDQRERDTPPDRPLRYHVLARQALRKGLISTGRYAEYLGISRRDAMRVMDQDGADDVQVEVADT